MISESWKLNPWVRCAFVNVYSQMCRPGCSQHIVLVLQAIVLYPLQLFKSPMFCIVD